METLYSRDFRFFISLFYTEQITYNVVEGGEEGGI